MSGINSNVRHVCHMDLTKFAGGHFTALLFHRWQATGHQQLHRTHLAPYMQHCMCFLTHAASKLRVLSATYASKLQQQHANAQHVLAVLHPAVPAKLSCC